MAGKGNKIYRLEITMESRQGDNHKYIKRSFPVIKGELDIRKYGYPYSKYKTIEITQIDYWYDGDGRIKLLFDGTEVNVCTNSFVTEKREYAVSNMESYMRGPGSSAEIIHTTFYLYIE